MPSKDTPKVAAANSTRCVPEMRGAPVDWQQPEIGTLDFSSMRSGQASVINVPWNLEVMAYIAAEKHCASDAQLVEKARLIFENLGGTIASPDQARAIPGMAGK